MVKEVCQLIIQITAIKKVFTIGAGNEFGTR